MHKKNNLVKCHKTRGNAENNKVFCTHTHTREWTGIPTRKLDGRNQAIKIGVSGEADSNYVSFNDTRKSFTGLVVKMTAITAKSVMQKILALSIKNTI